ncbi:MAG: chemotaxis protein [Desulfamplus sp.]|nr:chemotaxis protein [Desulfamplus sp.]
MNCSPKIQLKVFAFILGIIFSLFYTICPVYADEELRGFSSDLKKWAEECREEIVNEFDKLISSGKLKPAQIFDTFYIPMPDTYPQKYHTQYDTILDTTIQPILDKYLVKDKRLLFVVVVDKNGYLPTHNTIFSKPLTGDKDVDFINNRTKRLFNDKIGLAAARNETPYLVQKYVRDTGESIYDLSLPIMFQNQHWGAVRIGYQE